jgi:CRP-like cAMP-binding protein
MTTEIEQLKEINQKLERLLSIIPLLKILAKTNIDQARSDILSTSTRKEIFELCNGEKDIKEIAKKANTTKRYVNILMGELEEAGLVVVKKKGAKRYPKKTL